jgi:hypothetical protein
MNNRILSDQELAKMFEKDVAHLLPDAALRGKLEYAYLVKSRNYKTVQNSFAGVFTWLFSWTSLPAKVALVSIVLLVSIMNFQPRTGSIHATVADSTLTNMTMRIDTAGMLPFFADSCLTN